MNETVELLAPAGNSEAFYAAIENGADAIYIGIQGFSARNYASNFSLQQVKNNIDYAHSRNVKVYVALNTLIKKDEFKVALQIAHELYVQGVDALIVQDLGFLLFLKEKIPTFRLHVSTQLTVHNKLGVEYFEDIGIDRIILARELSLEEVKEIRKCTDIELEVFIHGSICLCYSGQCLMSSMIGGRSGNRGYCAQPCRHR
ncbi:U32 family peptidase, partial [Methanosalsum natronophilum]